MTTREQVGAEAVEYAAPSPEQGRTKDSPPSRRWYERRPAIAAALLLLYPVGLVLAFRSRRLRRWERIVGPIVFLPAFGLAVLVALKPFWEFAGAASHLTDFSLDFGRAVHDARVEKSRSEQKGAGSAAPAVTGDVSALSWPDFRGPRRDGACDPTGITFDWKRHPPRELYRYPIGGGYASFVIGEGRAYTIEQRRDREAVTCYDPASGRELWAFDYPASFEETLGGDGPRATPTLRDGRLYALGAQGHLHCLDAATGKLIWKRNVLAERGAENLPWGMSASPLLLDGKVIVTNSGKPGPSVLAFDARTGKDVWTCDAGVQGYSSPVAAIVAGKRQILNLSAAALNGIDPDDGTLLWRFPWTTSMGINVSQPMALGDDRIFISSGYGQGCAVVRLSKSDGTWKAQAIWSNNVMKNKFSSSVIHDGHAYGLDESVLCCVSLENGEKRWKGGRYGYGSVLLAGDYLLVMTEKPGRLVLVRATPERHDELGSAPIFEDKTWNNFAVVGGLLLARNHREMACYDLRAPAGDD